MMVRSTLNDISNNLERLQRSQTQVSTGKAFTRASQNPDAANGAMTARKELRQTEQRERALEDAKSWTSAADIQLTAANSAAERVRELGVQAVNPSTLSSPAARAGIAAEIRSLRTEILGAANSDLGGKPLFAGTAAGPAYDAAGSYIGNNGAIVRDVSSTYSMTINATGTQVFGDDTALGGNIFAVLDRMATAVEAADVNAIAAEQALLETRLSALRDASSNVGVNSASVERMLERNSDDKLRLNERVSKLEDVNLVDALVQVKTDETAYQASLQVVSKILPLSLLDYMR